MKSISSLDVKIKKNVLCPAFKKCIVDLYEMFQWKPSHLVKYTNNGNIICIPTINSI